jgi:hypothetical protein
MYRLHSSNRSKTRKPIVPARDRTFTEEDEERAMRRLEEWNRRREHQLRHSSWGRAKRGG